MRLRMSKKQAKIIILVIWLAALITSLPIAMLSQLENDVSQANSATRSHQNSPSSIMPSSSTTSISANISSNNTGNSTHMPDQPRMSSNISSTVHDNHNSSVYVTNLVIGPNNGTNITSHRTNYNSGVSNRMSRASEFHLNSNDVAHRIDSFRYVHDDHNHQHSTQLFDSHNSEDNIITNAGNLTEDFYNQQSLTERKLDDHGIAKRMIVYNATNSIVAVTTTPAETTSKQTFQAQADTESHQHGKSMIDFINPNSSNSQIGYTNGNHIRKHQQQAAVAPTPETNTLQHQRQQSDNVPPILTTPPPLQAQTQNSAYFSPPAENEKLYCHENWSFWPQGRYYYSTTLLILQFVIPLFVLVITYSRIVIIVWGKKMPGEEDDARDARMARSKRKVNNRTIQIVMTTTTITTISTQSI